MGNAIIGLKEHHVTVNLQSVLCVEQYWHDLLQFGLEI